MKSYLIPAANLFLIFFLLSSISHSACAPNPKGIDVLEGECQMNLRTIKSQIDRYYAEEGEYPRWLLGGSIESWQAYYERGGSETVFDPLLKSGYLATYPKNPFTSSRRGQYYIVKTGGIMGTAGSGDPRFGMDGTLMANIVDDPLYFETRPGFFCPTINQEGEPQWMNYGGFGGYIDENGEHARNVIPGSFFYRAVGDVNIVGSHPGHPAVRRDFLFRNISHYLLGVFGHEDTVGIDTIRLTGSGNYDTPSPYVERFDYRLAVALPEVFGGGSANMKPVFPYIHAQYYYEAAWFVYGAPDGIEDGVVLVLSDADGGINYQYRPPEYDEQGNIIEPEEDPNERCPRSRCGN